MNAKFYFFITLAIFVIHISCSAQNKRLNQLSLIADDTTGMLMNEDEFWSVVDESITASGGVYNEQVNDLKNILLKLDTPAIEKFDNTFTALLAVSYNWKLWGAAYVINGGCSDDCFDDFRQYLIAHGKGKFYETLKDPESCADWIKSEDEEEWEGFQYAAASAYKEKTGKDIPKSYNPDVEITGKKFDEDNVARQYPKLARKFIADY